MEWIGVAALVLLYLIYKRVDDCLFCLRQIRDSSDANRATLEGVARTVGHQGELIQRAIRLSRGSAHLHE